MDYAAADTATVLQYAGLCGVPELTGMLKRAGLPFAIVSGYRDDGAVWADLESWCLAAKAAKSVRFGRFGVLGHTYPGMLDLATDFEQVSSTLGTHIEVLEIEDVRDRADAAAETDVDAMIDVLRTSFAGVEHVSDAGLRESARIAVGVDRLAADFALDGLAYYYRGSGSDRIAQVASNLIVGNTLLTLRGIPAAGEGDLKTALAMKLMHELGGGGSFTEFLAMDFAERFYLMGHDGPCHPGIAEGKVLLKELDLFHGKTGGGVAVEMRVTTGPVTMVCLTQGPAGNLRLLVAEGESLPGPVPNIGNSCHRLRFGSDPAGFLQAWCDAAPTHHVALGLGHSARDVRRAGLLLGLEVVIVR
jgi:L-arabinose isomerase